MYFAEGNAVYKFTKEKKIILIKDGFASHWETVKYTLDNCKDDEEDIF
jgi:hypothetical protein